MQLIAHSLLESSTGLPFGQLYHLIKPGGKSSEPLVNLNLVSLIESCKLTCKFDCVLHKLQTKSRINYLNHVNFQPARQLSLIEIAELIALSLICYQWPVLEGLTILWVENDFINSLIILFAPNY